MSAAAPALRILIVTQDFFPETGGIQAYMLELARHFLAQGHQVGVICPGRANSPSPFPPDVEVTRFATHSSWLFLPLLFRMRGILRKTRPDVVVYAQWQSSLPELLLPRAMRRHRSLCLAHGRELLTSVLRPFHGPLCRAAFARADVAIPVSSTIETMLRRIGRPAGRVAIVHPGVDAMRFRPSPASVRAQARAEYGLGDAPVILSIARMVPRKGFDLLIGAMPRVLAQRPDARLVLGGEGPEEQSLRALARRLNVERAVLFIGRIPGEALVPHYGMADVFAMPSRQGARDVEGFGIVLVEAGACEVPVVATRTGGIVDAVADGDTGLLVAQEDEAALAAAILRLLDNPAEAARMGARARERVLAGLTWEATGDRFLDLMRAR
jgi:phosphatidylinositol alpha-1,6-mannosyltransferase